MFMALSMCGLVACLFTPRLLLVLPVLATVVCAVASLFRRERLAALAALPLFGAGALFVMSSQSFTRPPGRVVEVGYEVLGSARSVSLTYENAMGSTEQIADTTLPWHLDFNAATGQFLYVSAQAESGGTVTVNILRNGSVVKTATSEGEHTIASASFSVD
jgi:MmpS family membrane protein